MGRSLAGFWLAVAFALLTLSPTPVRAQSTAQTIFDDQLENGWQNWSWATVNLANTSPVHSGTDSIAVTAGPWQALYFENVVEDVNLYGALTFWINGGTTGGQELQVYALLSNVQQSTAYAIPPLKANTWQQITIPVSALGIAGQPDLDGFWIMDRTGTSQPTFYVDDVSLTPSNMPPPSTANLTVDASSKVSTVGSRMFGLNTGVWDFLLDTPDTVSALGPIGIKALRYPGGSESDDFDWSTDHEAGETFNWTGNPGLFANLVEQTASDAYVCVNYGSGTPQMAAAWVAWANAAPGSTTEIGLDSMGTDWKTAGYWASLRAAAPLAVDDGLNSLRQNHPAGYGFKYWEIGNEIYGSWENDQHGVSGSGLTGVAHDSTTYASAFGQFSAAMRAVDPSIKLGAVVVEGEDAYGTGLNPVPNPAEGGTLHSGWTPVMLATFKSLGITPDFLSFHRYPQTGLPSDYVALFDASTWQADATALRTMVTDYMGDAGTNVELDSTEDNSCNAVYKQSTSLVGGLYYADSFGSALSTEFAANLWWNMHQGSVADTTSEVYGWRTFGDFGILASGDRTDTPANTPYPTYYGARLCADWASVGDSAVASSTSYEQLSVHGMLKQNGHLSLLVVNKSASTDITGSVSLQGFSTTGATEVYSYGKTNDTGQTGLTTSTAAIDGSTFSYSFPSYSMTVIDMPFGHAMASGLQMVSAPFDYSGTSIGTLLGAGTTLYVWDSSAFDYAATPSTPADTFHLGTGYWVKMPAGVTLETMGTPAPTTGPFTIALQKGWNMVGDPFTSPVTISSLEVDTLSSTTPVLITKSSLVSLPLYAFNGTGYVAESSTDTIDPYAGYWVYATQACNLVIPAP